MHGDKHPRSNISPIANISSLASILSSRESEILTISQNIEHFHRPGKLLKKKNGAPRPTHDAAPELKALHEHIKNRILKKASYPLYMQGGIADPNSPRNCSSHAKIHSGKRIVIAEDIQDFFPSSSAEVVHEIWQHFFHFSPEVSELLTLLTTYRGALPQGWKTSGYLANLVFWNREPELVSHFEKRGLAYSRYMDDVTVSSKNFIHPRQKTAIITKIYGMLFNKGFSPKRSKHEVFTPSSPMIVTGLGVNASRPTIPKQERHQVRALVYQLEKRSEAERELPAFCENWRSASGKVGRIQSLHPREGKLLRQRLTAIKPPAHLLQKKKRRKKC